MSAAVSAAAVSAAAVSAAAVSAAAVLAAVVSAATPVSADVSVVAAARPPLVVIVARTPRQKPAIITSQALDFAVLLLLLLLRGKDVSKAASHSVASALLEEAACLCDNFKALKVLTLVMFGLVLSDILQGLKSIFTHVTSIVKLEASCFISTVGPLRVPDWGIYNLVCLHMLCVHVLLK